jgi:ATP-dependent DNA helicase RecG
MKSSLQKLQKFLKLEAERNFDNRAVVGGLDRILASWEAEARLENIPEEFIQAVSARLHDYPGLSPNSRAETLEGLWRRIQRESNLPATSLVPAPAAKPRTSSDPVSASPGSERSVPKPNVAVGPGTETRPATRSSMPRPVPEGPAAALEAPITVLPGVGTRHGQTLAHLEMRTLGDMLYHFPRRYVDYANLQPIFRLKYGSEVTVIGTIQSIHARPIRSGKINLTEAVLSDGSGALRITWFNQPWITKRVHTGMQVSVSGRIEQYLGRLVINNPEVEPLDQDNLHTNRIVPVYPLTANITQRWLRTLMYQVVSYWAPRVQDPLPNSVLTSADVLDIGTALYQVHFPDNEKNLKAARKRLAFDEIFYLQLGVLRQKHDWQDRTARIFEVDDQWLQDQITSLPYQLTSAQQRALEDLRRDLAAGHPMNRLLQGDVGSGKTIIAALGMMILAQHNAQSALLAPTSILAEQHFQNLQRLLCAEETGEGSRRARLLPGQLRLLIGATPEAERSEILSGLASGEIKIIVGTHALLEDPVIFSDLQFTVIDEQHRFGVTQRAALRNKGINPHLLVMTATPIPRSLALTVYGDLDLSVMDELPPGRQEIETQVFYPRERERAYALIRSQLALGYQAFIIYPLVEESENSEARAAVDEYARLQKEVFPKARLGLLHGRMRPDDKETVMGQFRDGEIQVLVSTSVVEVGVDVPNATVMLIDGANRFGLAQLHQFRGRVGRGSASSYCILIPDSPDAVENQRLSAMAETNNGFILAERDLEQRGPGDFLGTRQTGYQRELRMASFNDLHLIENARQQAQAVFTADPNLTLPEHHLMAKTLSQFWGEGQGDIS